MNIFTDAHKNMKQNLLRSAAIAITIAVLAAVLFSLSLIYSAMNNSIELSGKRLGADAMIVPAEYSEKTEDILLSGRAGSFTMRDSKALRMAILNMEGVEALNSGGLRKCARGWLCRRKRSPPCALSNAGYKPADKTVDHDKLILPTRLAESAGAGRGLQPRRATVQGSSSVRFRNQSPF